ncbi:ATP-binding cassette domain-containing protein [Fluviispira vulneris]|uniref:ATP-binding cassette domain-containing protein n=1 Tax=Fluviispira vulneris TaxID=2763012 RepID=UPI0016477F98
MLGLKGISGSGKTTLSLILNGIIQQTSGSIGCDNKIITPLELQALSIQVQQEPLFFDDSIIDNICLGNKNTDKEAVSQLLQRFLWEGAQVGKKNRLNEYISEAGKNLSGGEKRRLAIARTLFVENKHLFIFDEPTAGLDNDSASAVMTEIKNIADDKFIIVISHDERFDDLFDEIIFIASVGKT